MLKAGSRIEARFKELAAAGKKAFIPYIMSGDPSLNASLRLAGTLEDAGADIIELGVPFSDPVADGPLIQAAAERARRAGVNLRKALGLVAAIRKRSNIPIVLMTYYNPVLKFGEDKFAKQAVEAGADGVIVPDLPVEEADLLKEHSYKRGLDTIFLAAPTSGPERFRLVSNASTGFIYYVSLTGITGAKLAHYEEIEKSVKRLKKLSGGKAVAVGFGVSNPDEAGRIAKIADGVIVGSAVVRRAREDSARDFSAWLKSMREAIG
ncbi:MAG: tryptophan synthase subunit alpha [Nitrospiraceae bacterium]|nr:tryptophan synthase subunit alpha [Nitrospiraceae bacterium]